VRAGGFGAVVAQILGMVGVADHGAHLLSVRDEQTRQPARDLAVPASDRYEHGATTRSRARARDIDGLHRKTGWRTRAAA